MLESGYALSKNQYEDLTTFFSSSEKQTCRRKRRMEVNNEMAISKPLKGWVSVFLFQYETRAWSTTIFMQFACKVLFFFFFLCLSCKILGLNKVRDWDCWATDLSVKISARVQFYEYILKCEEKIKQPQVINKTIFFVFLFWFINKICAVWP